MTWIIHRPNIYDPSKDLPSYVGNCNSVREALVARFGTDTFDLPTYVTVNRVPTLRKHWDDRLPVNSTLEVITVPGAMAAATLTVLTLVSLAATAYLMFKGYKTPSVATAVGASVPDTSPVFTFAGQKNIQRLNNPVDCIYGKVRWWPAYLCAPRVEYVKNKPTAHIWLSLGKGNFEVEDVLVNNTSISTIAGAVYEYRDSPYTMTALDDFDLVGYAEDFNNTELLGTNEEDHAIVGPFELNPTNTVVDLVKVNFSFPSGLYGINSSGSITPATVTATIYLIEIDNNGIETGSVGEFDFTHTLSSTTPQRATEDLDPTTKTGWFGTGRYKISAVRTNAKNNNTNGQDRCLVEAAYSCSRSGKTFEVSLLHVVLPGTSAVDFSAVERINVIATRKLATISEGAFTTKTYPSRSVVLAILDVLRNSANISDSDFDMSYWASLIDILSEYNFDYRFDSKTTVWEAMQAIANCAFATPYYVGSDIRLSCDSPIKQPVLMLTADHTSDFSLSMEFKTEMENDCIEAAYVDPDTGLQDSVFFTPPGSEAKNPTKITFAGCTDRQEAWRLAAYTYLKRSLVRDRVSMSVSQDGKIPLLGEVVLLSMPLPSWTNAGLVESYVATETTFALGLSDSVPFSSGWIALRRSNGSVYGPIQFTATEGSFEVSLSAELSELFDFTGETKDYVAYTISSNTVITKKFEVESISPSKDSVKLELVEFNPDVFAYNNLSVPDRGDDMLPYPVANGPVPWIRVLDESGQFLKIERGPIYGEPTSVVCKYIWVETDCLDYPSLASSPWGFLDDGIVYPMLEADVVGNSFYIERQNKDLYIKFVVAYGASIFATWWRGRIGEFGLGLSIPLHVWIKNNCDNAYVAPESSSNESSPNAQGVSVVAGLGLLGNAVFDVAERKIEIQVDAPPGCPVYIKLTSETVTATITKSLTKASKDGGVVVFTERDLETAGCLILDPVTATTTYPIVKIEVWREGESASAAACYLDIQPLTTNVVEQQVVHYFVNTNRYIKGTCYRYETFEFVDFAFNSMATFRVVVNNSFNAGKIKYDFSYQNRFVGDEVISKTLTTTSRSIFVDRFRVVHLDNLNFKSLTSGNIVFDGMMRSGNRNPETYDTDQSWAVLLLDANFERIYEDIDFFNIQVGFGISVRTAFDTPTEFLLRGVPDYTNPIGYNTWATNDLEYLQENCKYMICLRQPAYFAPNVSSTIKGWGAVKATMVDMFGFYGNKTDWNYPDTDMPTP